MENIHPTFDSIKNRSDKEKLLGQKGIVLWFTGLSGSGKSTIAQHLEDELYKRGYFTQVLDGDNVRTGINNNLGFFEEDRTENIRRIAEVAKLFKEAGVITLCSFVSPTNAMRQMAREIIGLEDFKEIYVNAPLEVCEERDVKGLYAKARAGEIRDFTGIDAPFEIPLKADLEVRTDAMSVDEAVLQCIEMILPQISQI
jgi:adenylylsulfate kinase